MQKKIVRSFTFLIVIGVLISCLSRPNPVQKIKIPESSSSFILGTYTNTPSPTITILTPTEPPPLTQTLIPSATKTISPFTLAPSVTMRPTYTINERNDHLLELLQSNGDCEFPCYWSFTPGRTNWDDVARFLSYMGESSPWETSIQGYPFYDVEYQDMRDDILVGTSFYIKDKLIDFIMSQTIIRNNSLYFNKLSQIYSIPQFLNSQGMPSRILLELLTSEIEFPSSTNLYTWLFYDQKGYAIYYVLRAEKAGLSYKTCPNQSFNGSNQSLQFELIMQSPDNTRPLENIYTLLGMNINSYLTLDKATGMDINEFYQLVTQGSESDCFSTPRNIWP